MENKNLIKILVVLCVILIIAIILVYNLLISNNSVSTENKNGYVDSEYESTGPSISYDESNKYTPSVINKEYSWLTAEDRAKMDDKFDFLVNSINEKKYEELYALMTAEYKAVRFKTIEEFEKYMKENFSSECYCSSYKIESYGCLVNILLANGEKRILTMNNFKENISNEIVIYFEDIADVKSTPNRFLASDSLVEVKYIIQYPETTAFYVEVTNQGSKEMTINFADSELIRVVKGKENAYQVVNETALTISANQKKGVEIEFNYPGTSISLPDYISYAVNIDGKTYTIDGIVEVEENTDEA